MKSEIEYHPRDWAHDNAEHLKRYAAQVDDGYVGLGQIPDKLANDVGKVHVAGAFPRLDIVEWMRMAEVFAGPFDAGTTQLPQQPVRR